MQKRCGNFGPDEEKVIKEALIQLPDDVPGLALEDIEKDEWGWVILNPNYRREETLNEAEKMR